MHLFRGLFRKASDGKISADTAKDYNLSDNGLIYTITLKDDIYWKSYTDDFDDDNLKVTAYDYEFGLQRVFTRETKSPFTDTLGAIKNSSSVLNGQADISSLGVKALDDLTLQITLSHPDPMFIERLCSSGAMPCNREFFNFTNGAYGLSGKTILTNGTFYLYTWQAGKGIGISKSEYEKNDVNYLRMIVPGEKELLETTAYDRLENETTNGELVKGSQKTNDYHYKTFSTTTWMLVFNCGQKPFANEQIRTALSLSAHSSQFLTDDTQLETAQGIIPPSVTMLDQSYRQYVGNTMPTGDAVNIFRQGMNDAGLKNLSNVTVLVPNNPEYSNIFAEINQKWQKDLSVFFSVNEMPQEDIIKYVEKGNFQIALIPLTQSENDVLSVLSSFSKPDNLSRFSNAEFNLLLKEIENAPHGEERAMLYKQAEQLLLQCSPIVPLFYESSTYLYSKSIDNIVVNPYGPVIDITNAVSTG